MERSILQDFKDGVEEYIENLCSFKEKIKNKELIVEQIPQFTRNKLDLSSKLSILENYAKHIDDKEEKMGVKIEDLNLSDHLFHSKSSFIAPAYHLNEYLNLVEEYNINYMGKGFTEELEIIKIKFNVKVHDIFISIKSLLDRLVAIFTYYYPGITKSTTFGRIKDLKSSGLMSKVQELKDKDPLMMFIYEEYNFWIKSAVAPRDIVTHYNDLGFQIKQTMDGRIIPTHIEKKLFEKHNKPTIKVSFTSEITDEMLDDIIPTDMNYKDLIRFVNNLYDFFEKVFAYLICKDFKKIK